MLKELGHAIIVKKKNNMTHHHLAGYFFFSNSDYLDIQMDHRKKQFIV